MALKQVFINAAATIFEVFSSLIYKAEYVVITDDGFDAITRESTSIDLIMDNFAERDVQFLSFSALIQPTDVKGLVRGEQLSSVSASTQDVILIEDTEYSIIAFNHDPAKALFTFLLRNV